MAPVSVSPSRVVDAIKLLGIQQSMLDYIGSAPTWERAVTRLREILPDIKDVYRKVAFVTHPDRGGDADEFKAVNSAWAMVQTDAFAMAVWDVKHGYTEPTRPVPVTEVHTKHVVVEVPFRCVQFHSAYEGGTNSACFGGFSLGEPFFVRRM